MARENLLCIPDTHINFCYYTLTYWNLSFVCVVILETVLITLLNVLPHMSKIINEPF